jgi:hypothetical protein
VVEQTAQVRSRKSRSRRKVMLPHFSGKADTSDSLTESPSPSTVAPGDQAFTHGCFGAFNIYMYHLIRRGKQVSIKKKSTKLKFLDKKMNTGEFWGLNPVSCDYYNEFFLNTRMQKQNLVRQWV